MLSANDMVFLLNSEGTFFLDVILPMAHTEALPRKWSQQDGAAGFNRSFSNSHDWTGSGMKWRLMRANLFKCKLICPH